MNGQPSGSIIIITIDRVLVQEDSLVKYLTSKNIKKKYF